jgi:uncharacterized protein (TIGR02594 family)
MKVETLQAKLELAGFSPGRIDGAVGPKTARAFAMALADAFDVKFSVTWDGAANTLTATGPLSDAPTYDRPPWGDEAMRVLGMHEVHNNVELREWLRSDGPTLGDPAELPWCGDFVATAIRLALPDEPFTGRVRANPYLARNWQDFGEEVAPSQWSVAYFWRGSPNGTYGHVGFLVGEDDAYYHVLGGNQSNSVSISRIAKERLLGTRWPLTSEEEPQPLIFSSSGHAISSNEV